jgi:hypothetical protein
MHGNCLELTISRFFFFQKHDGRRISVTIFVAVSPSRHAPDTNATTNLQYITDQRPKQM